MNTVSIVAATISAMVAAFATYQTIVGTRRQNRRDSTENATKNVIGITKQWREMERSIREDVTRDVEEYMKALYGSRIDSLGKRVAELETLLSEERRSKAKLREENRILKEQLLSAGKHGNIERPQP